MIDFINAFRAELCAIIFLVVAVKTLLTIRTMRRETKEELDRDDPYFYYERPLARNRRHYR